VRQFPFTLSASALVSGWAAGQASATGPGAFQTLVSVGPFGPGIYTVAWTLTLAGSAGSADANNARLVLDGSTFLVESVNAGAAGTYPQAPYTLVIASGTHNLQMTAGPANATSGAVYTASVPAVGNAAASIGPSFPRESWDVAVASVSVSSNTNEAVCKIYAGPQAAQAWFADGTTWGSTGDSTSNFSAPVYLGSKVFAVWTGGDAGATATLVVTGTRRIP